jgi:hypothetical protein
LLLRFCNKFVIIHILLTYADAAVEEIIMAGKRCFFVTLAFICLLVTAGCRNYERQIVPFKMPENALNAITVDGAIIAAKSYVGMSEAFSAFGFDIRGAGVLPVQIAFDNKSAHPLIIIPDQTFLVDEENNAWPILDQNIAYERMSKAMVMWNHGREVVKSGMLLGAASATVAAAVGIVTGAGVLTVLDATGKAAAIGAAAGLTIGEVRSIDSADTMFKIRDDLKTRSLQCRAIKPGEFAYGFIFYPGEAKSAKFLRLQLKADDTGQLYTFNIKL